MAPRMDPVPATDTQPARTSVVVIGGGIVGCMTAFFLARKGIPVVLCEKGEIGAEQSGRNWGWTRVMGRDPREIPLAQQSLALWRQMNQMTNAETGFRQCGIAYLCETKAEMDSNAAWLEHARLLQVESRILGPDEVDSVVPGAARRFAGALFTPGDGRAEPTKAAPAVALAARALGATVLTGCAVRGVETTAGRISGVVTERGPIACDSVVLAGGAWSRLFTGNMGLGIDLPQLKVLGSVMATHPLDGAPDVSAGCGPFAFRKRLDGGYTVARRNGTITDITPDTLRYWREFLPALRTSWKDLRLRIGGQFLTEWRMPRRWALDTASPFEAVRTLDPAPHAGTLAEATQALAAAFPAFSGLRERERWAGLMDMMPDEVPVISAVAGVPGFHMATGFSGHGFGISPGAGQMMADLVTGDRPRVDPAPYDFARFARR